MISKEREYMDFVPETSLSPGDYTKKSRCPVVKSQLKVSYKNQQQIQAKRGKVKSFDSTSEIDSDFNGDTHAVVRLRKTETYRSPSKREYKSMRKNYKIKVTPKRKRSKRNPSSDGIESDAVNKAGVGHKFEPPTFKNKVTSTPYTSFMSFINGYGRVARRWVTGTLIGPCIRVKRSQFLGYNPQERVLPDLLRSKPDPETNLTDWAMNHKRRCDNQLSFANAI